MSTPLDNGRLARRIRQGGTTIGSFSGLGSPAAAEVMAAAGAEWVLLDLEHGGGSERLVGDTVPAVGAYGAATLVRVEQAERIRIGRVLDAGAAGVMLPRLSSAAEVEEAVRHLRYPPAGDRGVATYNRSVRWGMDREALGRAGDEAITIVQIETLGALEEVERIAAIDGVDVLFVGPLDLSYALGTPLDLESEPFRAAVDRVLAAASSAGICAGILSPTADAARQRAEQGFRFLAVGSDSTLLAAATSDLVARLTPNDTSEQGAS